MMLALAGPLQAQPAPAGATPAPARAAPAKFLIAAFDVSGVTKLPAEEVEEIVYPFSGPDRSSDDVERARKALQDAYTARGFESVQVDIPPQPEGNFAQGIVAIRVAEVPVGQVRVTGSRYHALSVVRDQVAAVQEGQPLNLKTLSTQLDAANRFPDRTVTPSFRAGKVPGTVDVDLKVEDTLPLHGSVQLDNDRSPNTRPLRVNATLRYTNLWQLGHTISGTYIVAPQDRRQSEVFSGSYSAPFTGTPWTLVLYGYSSNSNVAALGGSNVLGRGYQVGARAVYRLPAKSFIHNLSAGLDYKNFSQNISVNGTQAGSAPIHYIPLYASYGLGISGEKSTLDLTVSTTLGLRAIKKFGCFNVQPNVPCTPVDQFKNKDFDSAENFVHANIDLTYTHVLPRQFVGALKLTGQLSDSHLVTNEQFAIGGLATVRGYRLSEAVADDGYAGSLEIRSPFLLSSVGAFLDEMRLYGFVEGGQVHVRNALPDQRANFSLLSAGGGARVRALKHLSGELAVGVPLIDGVNTRAGNIRTTFSIKGEF